jgi:ATP-binding cassette subfamily F protein 1
VYDSEESDEDESSEEDQRGGGAYGGFGALDSDDDDESSSEDSSEERRKAAAAKAKAKGASKKPMTKAEQKRAAREAQKEKERGKAAPAAGDAAPTGPKSVLDQEEEEDDNNNSKDIHVDRVTITVPGRTLLHEAKVTLTYGGHYGLVGPNGTGKSTLMKAIANRTGDFSKVSKNISILYVDQEVPGDETRAIDVVMASDPELISLFRERDELEAKGDDISDADGERLGKVYEELSVRRGDSAYARAAKILAGLQFRHEEFVQPSNLFSGGWRKRLSLAQALFMRPDVLLLDEPSNHADLHMMCWLEQYLVRWKRTLVIVSHDREFLNTVCRQVLYMADSKIYSYKGDYDSFETAHKQFVTSQRKKSDKIEKRLKELKRQAAEARQRATASDKGSSKGKNQKGPQGKGKAVKAGGGAASKEKLAAEIAQLQAELVAVPKDENEQFDFPDPEHLPLPVIQVKDATFGYDSMNQPLFRRVDEGIDCETKIALIGRNGAGKSTLMKVMMGLLEPTEGEVIINRKLITGYFHQHQLEELVKEETPVEYLMRVGKEAGLEVDQGFVRRFLGRFGLTGKTQVTTIGLLSGGQRVRVSLAKLALRTPHIMFLDEPSNDLSLEAVSALTDGLAAYDGGLVFVTHDQRLIESVASEIWIVDRERCCIEVWDGSFADYKQAMIDEYFADMSDDEDDDWDEEARRRDEADAKKKKATDWTREMKGGKKKK